MKKNKAFTTSPNYHFTIARQEDLLANIDIWEQATEGVFEEGHFHSYYEILIFRKGGGTHQMGLTSYQVNDQAIHVLPGNMFHELKRTTQTDGFEIIFSEVFLNQLQQFDQKTNYRQYFSTPHVVNCTEEQFKELEVYFADLIKNKENKSIFYNLVSLIVLKIIAFDSRGNNPVLHLDFEKSLKDLLNRYYKEKKNSMFYASQLNMSINTFHRRTKMAFGKTLNELQNEKIVHELKFLLSKKERSIKEIQAEFNFSDESHFTHFFTKHIGVSPSVFRKSA